ncbi:hypothetical protein L1987_40451 [Smallanthus sonchifolius]|uniref:Uncharacterized protein n=1 Tax=Smallanthus sonchifolius TaxID=185202 RepID=A0ACB9GTZ0_9ASTR|nr:hypothetical protein L1987_40451 [Smallanthus sonchifolius]
MSTESTIAPLCRWYKNPSYLLDQMLIFRISFSSLNSQSRFPLISQSAADEGSRTEIKGFGILSSPRSNKQLKEKIGIWVLLFRRGKEEAKLELAIAAVGIERK